MDIAVMDLLTAANNIGPGILIPLRITLLRMDRHNMVIHIIHTATRGKTRRSRVKNLAKEVPNTKLGQTQIGLLGWR